MSLVLGSPSSVKSKSTSPQLLQFWAPATIWPPGPRPRSDPVPSPVILLKQVSVWAGWHGGGLGCVGGVVATKVQLTVVSCLRWKLKWLPSASCQLITRLFGVPPGLFAPAVASQSRWKACGMSAMGQPKPSGAHLVLPARNSVPNASPPPDIHLPVPLNETPPPNTHVPDAISIARR